MMLPLPRDGDPIDFHQYPLVRSMSTLGEPEKVIWSSIQFLATQGIIDRLLVSRHRIRSENARALIASNISVYINHASEFYEAARQAHSNTAPLLYYYAFLNLAKARCEIQRPNFHRFPESYRHGLSWRPNERFLVNPQKEILSVAGRGVWHVLYEALTGRAAIISNPARLKVGHLLSLCPEIAVEYGDNFSEPRKVISLIEPSFFYNEKQRESWLRFSIDREELKYLKLSGPKFIAQISPPRNTYIQVKGNNEDTKDIITFELANPKPALPKQSVCADVFAEVQFMNLFTHLDGGKLAYEIPLLRTLPLPIPQIVVLYTLMFWLGSLVRYDPHSVEFLRRSRYWSLVEGFMNQSRIWLLELFEWEFYQQTTTLVGAR